MIGKLVEPQSRGRETPPAVLKAASFLRDPSAMVRHKPAPVISSMCYAKEGSGVTPAETDLVDPRSHMFPSEATRGV